MNKQHILILLCITIVINIATSYIASNYVFSDGFNGLSLENKQQIDDIHNINTTIKDLTLKISKLQKQLKNQAQDLFLAQETNGTVINELNSDAKNIQLAKEISLIKQQLDMLAKTSTASIEKLSQSNFTLLPSNSLIDISQTEPQTIEAQREKAKEEAKKEESSYEVAFYDGDDDTSWTNNIEAKVGSLIDSNELGENTQLLDIECRSKLCKINLAHSGKDFDDFSLIDLLGNVDVFIKTKDNGVSGQQELIVYFSKEGGNLPDPTQFN